MAVLLAALLAGCASPLAQVTPLYPRATETPLPGEAPTLTPFLPPLDPTFTPLPDTAPPPPPAELPTDPPPIPTVLLPSDTAEPLPPPTVTDTPLPPEPPPTELVTRFAVIGDYGQAGQASLDVSNLIKSWGVDFIITTGDNNYPSGSADTIDENIGQYYQEYIYPYYGAYGPGADQNRFFPTLGNHDWDSQSAQPYLEYFSLPGNEYYYDFVWGPVHFFALDGDSRTPDGVSSSSIQAAWLQDRLANSLMPWKLVYMHQPPYSSGMHGSVTWMRWPFREWGASVVLTGHDHTYERLIVDGLPYFVNGVGGGAIYYFNEPALEGSQVRFNGDYGAMLVTASDRQMNFQFITRGGEVIDSYTLESGES